MTELPAQPPLPGECHPAYLDQQMQLLDWLRGRGHSARQDTIVAAIATSSVPFVAWDATPPPSTITARQILMTRHRVQGAAPFVGRPFHYEWTVGVDELGRGIATQAYRVADTGRLFRYFLASTPEDYWPSDPWLEPRI